MTISVLIATYNRAALLRECLEHLLVQAFGPGDEVIIVDNASTDDTRRVVSDAAGRLPVAVRYLRETTPGKTPALTAGIAAARGDVLAFTDDDVSVAGDWIATVRRLFEDPVIALVGGRVDGRWGAPVPRWLATTDRGAYGRMTSPLALVHYGEAQELGSRTAMGANMAVRRQVFDAVGGLSPALGRFRDTLLCGEDHEFCQRVRSRGYRCEYRPELRAYHWVPADRLTLRYYARWFWWAGVTNAKLESPSDEAPSWFGTPRYIWGRLALAAPRLLASLAAGRLAQAVEHLVDGAFSAGYVWERVKEKRQEVRVDRQQAPQLPASAQTPAIPASSPQARS